MKASLPKIKTKYIFQLVRDTTNELLQEIVTHNEMTPYFWYHESYYDESAILSLSSDTIKPDATTATLSNVLWSVAASARSRTRKNTVCFTFIIPASTDKVGTVGSFGILYGGGAKYRTVGQLLDAEGNPLTITKTSLDKLIINVEWEFVFNSGDFTWFDEYFNSIFHMALIYDGSSFHDSCQFQIPLQNSITLSTIPADKGIAPARFNGADFNSHSYAYMYYYDWDYSISTTWNYETVNDHFKKPTHTNTIRLAQEPLPNRYINSIGIKGIGCFNLPNPDIFPVYTLSGIEVGTGDGQKTDFECPIPWFLKDTDVLYKNGVALTRGVDYTIDNKHNRQKCLSISEGNFAKIIAGNFRYIGTKDHAYQNVSVWTCPFIPFAACIDPSSEYTSCVLYNKVPLLSLKNNVPLILDMGEAKEINYFVSPRVQGNYADKLKLSYSDDNQVYTEVGEVSVLTSDISAGTPIPEQYTLKFGTISARYWKVDITSTQGEDNEYIFPSYTNNDAQYTTPETSTKMYNKCGFLGYVGEPIKFNVAPAEGDIITLDVSLDRPYKTTQNVIDIAMSYDA